MRTFACSFILQVLVEACRELSQQDDRFQLVIVNHSVSSFGFTKLLHWPIGCRADRTYNAAGKLEREVDRTDLDKQVLVVPSLTKSANQKPELFLFGVETLATFERQPDETRTEMGTCLSFVLRLCVSLPSPLGSLFKLFWLLLVVQEFFT